MTIKIQNMLTSVLLLYGYNPKTGTTKKKRTRNATKSRKQEENKKGNKKRNYLNLIKKNTKIVTSIKVSLEVSPYS